MCAQRTELSWPEGREVRDPVCHVAERRRVQPVEPLPAFAPVDHQPGVLQCPEVLRERGRRHAESSTEPRGRFFAGALFLQHRAPQRVGEREERILLALEAGHGREDS